MLTITGQKYRFCDGLSRRGFLEVGGLAFGWGDFAAATSNRYNTGFVGSSTVFS